MDESPSKPSKHQWILSHLYPSLLCNVDVEAMINLAAQLPVDAVAVEIGSKFGGSAKLIADHVPMLKALYCIDIGWLHEDRPTPDDTDSMDICRRFDIDIQKTCYEIAVELLSPYPITKLLKLSSPYDLAWWSEPVDFVFEDSSHSNPQLRDNLRFWWQHLRSGGILAGHDYNAAWPEVIAEVDSFAKQNDLVLTVQGNVWHVVKP